MSARSRSSPKPRSAAAEPGANGAPAAPSLHSSVRGGREGRGAGSTRACGRPDPRSPHLPALTSPPAPGGGAAPGGGRAPTTRAALTGCSRTTPPPGTADFKRPRPFRARAPPLRRGGREGGPPARRRREGGSGGAERPEAFTIGTGQRVREEEPEPGRAAGRRQGCLPGGRSEPPPPAARAAPRAAAPRPRRTREASPPCCHPPPRATGGTVRSVALPLPPSTAEVGGAVHLYVSEAGCWRPITGRGRGIPGPRLSPGDGGSGPSPLFVETGTVRCKLGGAVTCGLPRLPACRGVGENKQQAAHSERQWRNPRPPVSSRCTAPPSAWAEPHCMLGTVVPPGGPGRLRTDSRSERRNPPQTPVYPIKRRALYYKTYLEFYWDTVYHVTPPDPLPG